MKCYVINLDRSTRRLERISSQFFRLGLEFLRVPAVDGESLAPEILAPHQSERGKFYCLGPGEIACFMSHQRCWEHIAEGIDDFGAVFEDDVRFGRDAEKLLARDEWIPADADIIKLETYLMRTFIDVEPMGEIAGRTLHRLRGDHAGCAAYIVSRPCAARLLAMSRTFIDPVDQFVFNPALPVFDTLTVYQLTPALCIQNGVLPKSDDDEEELSTLENERRGKFPGPSSKLYLELRRPFLRIYTFITCYLRGRRWSSIKFM